MNPECVCGTECTDRCDLCRMPVCPSCGPGHYRNAHAAAPPVRAARLLAVIAFALGLVSVAGAADFDPANPAKMKGTVGKLSGTFTVHKVRPIEKFTTNAQIKLGDQFYPANYLNGTVQITPQTYGTDGGTVLLKFDTEGVKEGDQITFTGEVSVRKHTGEIFLGNVGGRNLTQYTTYYLLTPKTKAKTPAKTK